MYPICMKGNIYADKCSCGGKMTHNERKHNCFCSVCGAPAAKGYKVRFGREITKRFGTILKLHSSSLVLGLKRLRAHLMCAITKQTIRYRLKFKTARWLVIKEKEVSPETYRKYYRYINRLLPLGGASGMLRRSVLAILKIFFLMSQLPKTIKRGTISDHA